MINEWGAGILLVWCSGSDQLLQVSSLYLLLPYPDSAAFGYIFSREAKHSNQPPRTNFFNKYDILHY